MARKTKEESAKTRKRILDAAEVIFSRWGVTNATLAHIAETAGISRGAIYGHYKNKIEVCLAMCHRAYAEARPPQRWIEESSPLEALYLICAYAMRMVYGPSSLQRAVHVLYFKCEDTEENAPLFHLRTDMERKHRRDMLRLLRQAVAQGELPPDLDLPLAYIHIDSIMSGVYHAQAWPGRLRRDFWGSVDRIIYTGIEALRHSPYLRRLAPLPPPAVSRFSDASAS